MKKYISFIAFFCCMIVTVSAQRFCYVDTQYVLENLPEYTSSQKRLQSQTDAWQKEIEIKKENFARTQANFEAEKILLTAEQMKEQETKLSEEADAIRALQDKRYGPLGDLISLRRSMVKPLQDQIYNATKQVADKRGYSFVFDKGSDLIMIYTDPKFDISRDVLAILKPETAPSKTNQKNNQGSNQSSTNQRSNTNQKVNKGSK